MRYERLTPKDSIEIYNLLQDGQDNTALIKMALRLQELEDKIERGNFVLFPCTVGDRIWIRQGKNVFGRKVHKLSVLADGIVITTCTKSGWRFFESHYLFKEIGDTLFFTREEAEQKCEQLKKNEQLVRCNRCGAIFNKCAEGDYLNKTGEYFCSDCLIEIEFEDEDKGDE